MNTVKVLRTAFFYEIPLVSSAASGLIRGLEIMLSVYKLNMTIMSFQRKRNVDI